MKRALSVLLAFAMVLSLGTVALANPFTAPYTHTVDVTVVQTWTNGAIAYNDDGTYYVVLDDEDHGDNEPGQPTTPDGAAFIAPTTGTTGVVITTGTASFTGWQTAAGVPNVGAEAANQAAPGGPWPVTRTMTIPVSIAGALATATVGAGNFTFTEPTDWGTLDMGTATAITVPAGGWSWDGQPPVVVPGDWAENPIPAGAGAVTVSGEIERGSGDAVVGGAAHENDNPAADHVTNIRVTGAEDGNITVTVTLATNTGAERTITVALPDILAATDGQAAANLNIAGLEPLRITQAAGTTGPGTEPEPEAEWNPATRSVTAVAGDTYTTIERDEGAAVTVGTAVEVASVPAGGTATVTVAAAAEDANIRVNVAYTANTATAARTFTISRANVIAAMGGSPTVANLGLDDLEGNFVITQAGAQAPGTPGEEEPGVGEPGSEWHGEPPTLVAPPQVLPSPDLNAPQGSPIATVQFTQTAAVTALNHVDAIDVTATLITTPTDLPVIARTSVSAADDAGGTPEATTRRFTVTVIAQHDGVMTLGDARARNIPIVGSIDRIDFGGVHGNALPNLPVNIEVDFEVPGPVEAFPNSPAWTNPTATALPNNQILIGDLPGVLVGPQTAGLATRFWTLNTPTLSLLNGLFLGASDAGANNFRVINGTTLINGRTVPGHITGNIAVPQNTIANLQDVTFSLHIPDYALVGPAFNTPLVNGVSVGNVVRFEVERLGPTAGERFWLQFNNVNFGGATGVGYQIPNNWSVDGIFDELAVEQVINELRTLTGDDATHYLLRPMDFTWRIPNNFWTVGANGHRDGVTWSEIEHMIGVPGDRREALRVVHFDRAQLRTSRTTGMNGTIRDVMLFFPADGGANVRIRTLEFMTRTGNTNVEMDLSLAITGASAARMGRIFLRVGNTRLYVQSDAERIDPNHREYMRADGTVRNVEIYAGAGVYFTRNITSGQDLYVAAALATHDGFDTLFQQHAALVDIIEVHASTGWTTAQVQTRIDRDETLFVYDAERRLIGTTADNNLRFSTLYFLTTAQIDLGAGAGGDAPTNNVETPGDFGPAPGTGGDGGAGSANVNNNFNPGTGR